VHTHLRDGRLDRDDITDLERLSLDLVAAVQVTPEGLPGPVHVAHLALAGGEIRALCLEPVHASAPGIPVDALIAEIEAEMARGIAAAAPVTTARDGALLVHVEDAGSWDSDDVVSEMAALMDTAGVPLLRVVRQRRSETDPRHLVGRGKLDEILSDGMRLGCELVVFSRDLTAGQARAVSDLTEMRVIDRTQLILDIFARRARSRAGRIQVELAQLRYNLPRLAHRHTELSRLAGGIGGRGPGESKLEMDRRKAKERIRVLEQQVDALGRQREQSRRLRGRREVPVVSLVGYTNAGKSTLLNTLTRAGVLAEDRLFATLDPTSRRLGLPGHGDVVLTDTVGFIRAFPTELRAAFRATLEELEDATVLVHVADCSDPAWTAGSRRSNRSSQGWTSPACRASSPSTRWTGPRTRAPWRRFRASAGQCRYALWTARRLPRFLPG
jgi:GTP-binding protein HflX